MMYPLLPSSRFTKLCKKSRIKSGETGHSETIYKWAMAPIAKSLAANPMSSPKKNPIEKPGWKITSCGSEGLTMLGLNFPWFDGNVKQEIPKEFIPNGICSEFIPCSFCLKRWFPLCFRLQSIEYSLISLLRKCLRYLKFGRLNCYTSQT